MAYSQFSPLAFNCACMCVCVCAHVYTCVGRTCLCMPVGVVVYAGNLNLAFLIKYIRNEPHS